MCKNKQGWPRPALSESEAVENFIFPWVLSCQFSPYQNWEINIPTTLEEKSPYIYFCWLVSNPSVNFSEFLCVKSFSPLFLKVARNSFSPLKGKAWKTGSYTEGKRKTNVLAPAQIVFVSQKLNWQHKGSWHFKSIRAFNIKLHSSLPNNCLCTDKIEKDQKFY